MGVCKFWKSLSICNKLDTVLSAVVCLFVFLGKLSHMFQIRPPAFFDVATVFLRTSVDHHSLRIKKKNIVIRCSREYASLNILLKFLFSFLGNLQDTVLLPLKSVGEFAASETIGSHSKTSA